MTIKMKALRSFGTKKGGEGHVRRGSEFDVAEESRAKELEARGFAHRTETKTEPAPLNKMEPRAKNKAAEEGPLGSVGGETGEQSDFASLPDRDRVQPLRVSRRPRVTRE